MPTCRSKHDHKGRKFIYVHVPKTAGVSVSEMIRDCSEPFETDLNLRKTILDRSSDLLGRYQGILFWNITIDDLRAHYGNKFVNEHYSFAFLRNPWEWLVSMYSFVTSHKDHPESMICGHMSFKQFLRFFLAKRVTQSTFISVNGDVAVDRVFPFESLPEALDQISREIGIPIPSIPHANKSLHGRYQDFYDPEDREAVELAFYHDIALGNYHFEDRTTGHPALAVPYQYFGPSIPLKKFILDGVPRSGTTALCSAISLHPNCFCANERYQIFADHSLCLTPDNLLNERTPSAFVEEAGIIEENKTVFLQRERKLHIFGNKTPRYYFNALEICRQQEISYVLISRNPLETCSSWNARAKNITDAWRADDTGLIGMLEYIQACHVLLHIQPSRAFIVSYDEVFFDGWREGITKLLRFLGTEPSSTYLSDFADTFVRQRKGAKDMHVIDAEEKFYHISKIGPVHEFFASCGSNRLSDFTSEYRARIRRVFDNIDETVLQYFQLSQTYPLGTNALGRILTDQSYFFARSRHQSFITPLLARSSRPHYNAWLGLILFYRRAFAASQYFYDLEDTRFSGSVRLAFQDASKDMPYIFSRVKQKGLDNTFKDGYESLNVSRTVECARLLDEAGLKEDAQILRMRAIGASAYDAPNLQYSALDFSTGEAKITDKLDIKNGTRSSMLTMDQIVEGFL